MLRGDRRRQVMRLRDDDVWQIEMRDDCLVFGPETRGLPGEILSSSPETNLKIPMDNRNIRSLNLANSVAIVLFEALRQLNHESR